MVINDWLKANPDSHLRVICYTPAPDIMDEYGNLVCGGEGTSAVMFDSTVSGDFPFDLLWRDITAINEGDDGIPELEYLPDEEYWLGN